MSDDTRESGRPRPARPSKPTPVRALDDAPPTRKEGPGPPPERVTLEVGNEAWTAEVAGQAVAAGGTGMLLVRFAEGELTAGDHESEPAREEALEAWVVGTRLEDLSPSRLEEALARAGPWKGSKTDRPFFADEGGRRGR